VVSVVDGIQHCLYDRKVVKESVVVDHLAGHALEDYEVLNFGLPGEEVLIAEDNGKMNDW